MKAYLPLLVVCIAVALWVSASRRSTPPAPVEPVRGTEVTGLTVNGVRPGMSEREVLVCLGTPTSGGPLEVRIGLGSWAEYGSPSLTWEGNPTITYTPQHTVLSVIGKKLLVDGTAAFRVDGPDAGLDQRIGAPYRLEKGSPSGPAVCHSFTRPQGTLNVFTEQQKITRILWSSVP